MAHSAAYTFKDTYWNKKRVEADVSISELADLMGVKRATMGAYCSGYLVPHPDVMKQMCEFFGVDFIKGKSEFEKAHKAWDATHKRTLKASARKPKKTKDKTVDIAELVVQSNTPLVTTSVHSNRAVCETILKAVYHKVDYDDYSRLSDYLYNGTGDPLEVVYGKVDLKTFRYIEKALESVPEVVIEIDSNASKWEI